MQASRFSWLTALAVQCYVAWADWQAGEGGDGEDAGELVLASARLTGACCGPNAAHLAGSLLMKQ